MEIGKDDSFSLVYLVLLEFDNIVEFLECDNSIHKYKGQQ